MNGRICVIGLVGLLFGSMVLAPITTSGDLKGVIVGTEEADIREVLHISSGRVRDPYGRGYWVVNMWIYQLINDPDEDYDYYLIHTRVNDNTGRALEGFQCHERIRVEGLLDPTLQCHPYVDDECKITTLDLNRDGRADEVPWSPESHGSRYFLHLGVLGALFNYIPRQIPIKLYGNIELPLDIKCVNHICFTPNTGENCRRFYLPYHNAYKNSPYREAGEYEVTDWTLWKNHWYNDDMFCNAKKFESIAVVCVPDKMDSGSNGNIGFSILFSDRTWEGVMNVIHRGLVETRLNPYPLPDANDETKEGLMIIPLEITIQDQDLNIEAFTTEVPEGAPPMPRGSE